MLGQKNVGGARYGRKTMSEVPNPAKNDVRRADIGVSRTKTNFGQETGDKRCQKD